MTLEISKGCELLIELHRLKEADVALQNRMDGLVDLFSAFAGEADKHLGAALESTRTGEPTIYY